MTACRRLKKKVCRCTKEQLLSQIATVLAKHKQLLSHGGVRFLTLSELAVRRLQGLVRSGDCPANLELRHFDTVGDEESKLCDIFGSEEINNKKDEDKVKSQRLQFSCKQPPSTRSP